MEKDTLANVRLSFFVGFFAWAVPAFLCLLSAMRGSYQMLDSSYSSSLTSVFVTKDTIVSQTFENTAEEIQDLQLCLGNCGRVNESALEISLVEEKSENLIYKNEIPLETIDKDNDWYSMLNEAIDVTPGETYRIEIRSEADESNCIAVYVGDAYNEKSNIEIDGALQEGALALKIKGKR